MISGYNKNIKWKVNDMENSRFEKLRVALEHNIVSIAVMTAWDLHDNGVSSDEFEAHISSDSKQWHKYMLPMGKDIYRNLCNIEKGNLIREMSGNYRIRKVGENYFF